MKKTGTVIASLLLLLLLSAAPARTQYILGNLPLTTAGCTTVGQAVQYNPATKSWECVSKYGGMYFYTSSAGAPTAQAINITQQYHGVYLTATGGSLSGWTLKAGTSGTIDAVADNGGVVVGTILITTAAAHNLAVGDYVVQNGFTTRTTYRGKYRVLTTPLATTYTVTRAFEVATDTGWFQRSWSMTAGAGSAGLYRVTFSMSAEADSNTTDFRWEVNKNDTDLDNIAAQNFYSTSARAQSTAATGIVSIADGDVLYMSVKNLTDAADWKIWLANLVATRI
jgi:hypothetical protein